VPAVADISLILFDLNGVLYRYDRDARMAYLGSLAGVSPDAIRAAIWDSGFEDSGDAGALDEAAYLRGFGTRIGYDLSEGEWLAAQQAAVTPIPDSLAVLSRIRPDVQCAVLTNNNLLIRRHFEGIYPEIDALMGERMYVSAEFGARKPAVEVYHQCLNRLAVAPAAALFVDDSQANVDGAREAGLESYHYTVPDELAVRLQRYGVLLPRETV
jgi:glucose-1-phosphatase